MRHVVLISFLLTACSAQSDSDSTQADAAQNGISDSGMNVGDDDSGTADSGIDGRADGGTTNDDPDAGTPVLPPTPTPTPITLSASHFLGDATAPRSVSAWGIESYPEAIPKSTRSTILWGRFQNNACATPGYGLNVEHPLAVSGIPVFQGFYPECASAYGPSVDADVYAHDAPQHLLRSKVTPGGAFQSFGPAGQNATGANAYIGAAYTSFTTPWRSNVPNRLRPWGGSSATPDLIRVALIVQESVTQAVLEDPSQQQLQQVLWMNVINESCDIASSSSFCQIQLNFKTYIRGVGAYTTFDEGSAFNDGGQGGLIAVVGPIAASGQSTSVSGSPAWTSWASSTQVAPFDDKKFQVEISWTQFQQLLINVTGGNPAAVFGASWQDRNTWVLLDVGYGQENYNASATATSTIEGLFESIEILAL